MALAENPEMSRRALASDAVLLVASIDTEEDNWRPTRDGIRIENIRELPALQRFLVGLGLRPTYFADHPVASEPWSAAILREIAESGAAEIGAHLHPWNTPPLDEALLPRNSMLKNLAGELQGRKLRVLRDALAAATGRAPTSFRAGRFGLGPETVSELIGCGFRVDSSVTPWIDWEEFDDGPDFRGAPQGCYRIRAGQDPRTPAGDGALLELPLSCGFTRRPFGWRAAAHGALRRSALRRLPLAGLASRLGIVRRVTLTPEGESVETLLQLAERLLEQGERFLQLFWHSPSLVPGLSPFVTSAADRDRLFATIDAFVNRASKLAHLVPMTVSEAAEALDPRLQPGPG
jgi:hypothetical protein